MGDFKTNALHLLIISSMAEIIVRNPRFIGSELEGFHVNMKIGESNIDSNVVKPSTSQV